MKKKLGFTIIAAALGFVAFSTTAPTAARAQPEELACKPTGAKCKNSIECCKGCTFTNDSGKGICS